MQILQFNLSHGTRLKSINLCAFGQRFQTWLALILTQFVMFCPLMTKCIFTQFMDASISLQPTQVTMSINIDHTVP